MSAPQPDEGNIDHGEVNRRDDEDVTPVGPTRGPFGLMTGLMVAVVVLVLIWFVVTQVA